ncbi:MAG: M20/M25/M40 family metallo-hydrolase [Bacteroidales bacterium]|nr:M20/M25/M40 family metallo-hydrolase [Bacteroidales bacterium]
MKKILPLCLLLLTLLPGGGAANAQSRKDRLTEYIGYFASDSLKGRGAATRGAILAREYIAARYKECGLQPFFGGGFMVPFTKNGTSYCNVVGLIEGSTLKDEYIVLGAHYDHLGEKNGQIYPGADDNASGSAALIEIARALCEERGSLQRSVIIAAFDAEEIGLYGSTALAEFLDGLVGIEHIKLMMSVDMVGRYNHSGKLTLEGVATIRDGKVLAQETARRHSVNVRTKNFETSVLTATDTDGFARKGVPTLAVSTGLHPQYHKPSDRPELIDYEGLDKVTGYLSDFALQAASDPSLEASGRLAGKHSGKARTFEFGVTASVGQGRLAFPKADFTTRPGMAYSAGITSLINIGKSGFQLDVLYENAGARFPSTAEPFGRGQNFRHSAVTVPLYLRLKTGEGGEYGFIGFGGFYSYCLSHSFDNENPAWGFNPHEGGIAANFGIKVAGLMLSWDFRWQLGDLFPSGEPARLRTGTYLKASWLF